MKRRLLMFVLVALTLVEAPRAQEAGKRAPVAGARRNFVSCPIVRDTKTVPCFLAEWNGEVYFLGIQEDIGAAWFPPQLNHQVLVEGTIADGPRVCGGIPLQPLVTSVLPELDTACNTILPAEENIAAPTARRGPGPSTEERRAPLPAPSAAANAPAPAPPTAPKAFTLTFDFDNDFMPGRVTRIISDAVRYAKAANATRVSVVGYRATTLLSDGRPFVESPLIAERRAKKIETILLGLGIPATSLHVEWKKDAEPGDGVTDPQKRRVVIAVAP
jgi:outer membrane protein OmpA-like peptidoglycan-associated protein